MERAGALQRGSVARLLCNLHKSLALSGFVSLSEHSERVCKPPLGIFPIMIIQGTGQDTCKAPPVPSHGSGSKRTKDKGTESTKAVASGAKEISSEARTALLLQNEDIPPSPTPVQENKVAETQRTPHSCRPPSDWLQPWK